MGLKPRKRYKFDEIALLAQIYIDAEAADIEFDSMSEDERKSHWGNRARDEGARRLEACEDAGLRLAHALADADPGALRPIAIAVANERVKRNQATLKRAAAWGPGERDS